MEQRVGRGRKETSKNTNKITFHSFKCVKKAKWKKVSVFLYGVCVGGVLSGVAAIPTQVGALEGQVLREALFLLRCGVSLTHGPRCTEAQGCPCGWVPGPARRVAAAGRHSALSSGDPTLCIAIPECAGPEDLSGRPQPRMVPLTALCKLLWDLGVHSSQELMCAFVSLFCVYLE